MKKSQFLASKIQQPSSLTPMERDATGLPRRAIPRLLGSHARGPRIQGRRAPRRSASCLPRPPSNRLFSHPGPPPAVCLLVLSTQALHGAAIGVESPIFHPHPASQAVSVASGDDTVYSASASTGSSLPLRFGAALRVSSKRNIFAALAPVGLTRTRAGRRTGLIRLELSPVDEKLRLAVWRRPSPP